MDGFLRAKLIRRRGWCRCGSGSLLSRTTSVVQSQRRNDSRTVIPWTLICGRDKRALHTNPDKKVLIWALVMQSSK